MDAREVVKLFYGDSSKLEEKGYIKSDYSFEKNSKRICNIHSCLYEFTGFSNGFFRCFSRIFNIKKKFSSSNDPCLWFYQSIYLNYNFQGETNDDLLKAIEERIGKVLPGFKKELIESF